MDDNRQQMIAQIKALKELQRRRAKRTFHDFLQYVNPKYEMKWYHRLIADYCQMLFEGVVPKLMVTCPPPLHHQKLMCRASSTKPHGWKKRANPASTPTTTCLLTTMTKHRFKNNNYANKK